MSLRLVKYQFVLTFVFQDPLWWADPKFEKFKGKVLELDSRAEFHRTDRLKVRCGQCGIYIICRAENNMERFREHRRSQKCKKGAGDQPSLNKFFVTGALKKARAKPVVHNVSCPGLGHCQDPQITRYLSRSSACYGGAPHRSALKKQILKFWPRRPGYRRLSLKELQSRIKTAERAQVAWSNDHSAGVVFSTKCTSRAIVEIGSSLVLPCNECRKILHLRIFRNALRRLPPKIQNWKYTPKEYRNELLGKAYMRHAGVQEFMKKVREIL
jgi:hypothetical protein